MQNGEPMSVRESAAAADLGPPMKTTYWGLIAANALSVALALWNDWSIGALVWPFWFQSVVIGAFNVRRMLLLRQFSTKGLTSNGKRVPETEAGKRSTAWFFALHYGVFHLFFVIALLMAVPRTDEFLPLLVCCVALLIAQWQAHRDEVTIDARGRPNLGVMMFAPYARVFPMGILLVCASAAGAQAGMMTLVIGALKTLTDLAGHAIEQYLVAQSGRDKKPG